MGFYGGYIRLGSIGIVEKKLEVFTMVYIRYIVGFHGGYTRIHKGLEVLGFMI